MWKRSRYCMHGGPPPFKIIFLRHCFIQRPPALRGHFFRAHIIIMVTYTSFTVQRFSGWLREKLKFTYKYHYSVQQWLPITTVNLVKLATVLSEKASTIVIIRDHYKVRMNRHGHYCYRGLQVACHIVKCKSLVMIAKSTISL